MKNPLILLDKQLILDPPVYLKVTNAPVHRWLLPCNTYPRASTFWTVSAFSLNGKPWGLSVLPMESNSLLFPSFSHLATTVSELEALMLYQGSEL